MLSRRALLPLCPCRLVAFETFQDDILLLNFDTKRKMYSILVKLDASQDKISLLNEDTESNMPIMLKILGTSQDDILLLNPDAANTYFSYLSRWMCSNMI